MQAKKFDLNIEKIFEDWEVFHAIREVIANAIDEQILTNTGNIRIFQEKPKKFMFFGGDSRKGKWHIRDYGRGIRYDHLTQKENEEKLSNPNVIGKFGIGLKDALATFDRKGVKVYIKSKYGDITIGKSQKHDFEDIQTLHAYIAPPSDPNFTGTEFILENVTKEDVEKAKNLFLIFSGERVIERTKFGEVLEKNSKTARIYINGVKVAEEENFIFSYNITSLTKKIRQALNRERTNVGRSAYSDRIKSILLACGSKEIAEYLVDDFENFSSGEMHDELNWIDVQEHAVRILNASEKVLFLTSYELMEYPSIVDEAKKGKYRIVVIPENLKERIGGLKDFSGGIIRDFEQFYKEYEESFEYKFVSLSQLTANERKVFKMADNIFDLIGGKPKIIKSIKISETIKKEIEFFDETAGIWDSKSGSIIIKRNQGCKINMDGRKEN